MSNLSNFVFEGHDVRTFDVGDTIEWVALDVTDVLGVDRTQVRRLEDYQKGVRTIHTLGGQQEMVTITEAGLYALIFTSRKEVAKRFQRWVFTEVLPSIRKTGSYSALDLTLREELSRSIAAAEARDIEVQSLKKEVSELRSAILSLAGSDRKFKRRLESVGFTPSLTEEVMEEIARRVERKYKGKEVSWTNLRTYGRSSSLHRTLRKKELNDICDRFGWEWVNSKVSV